MCIRDSNKTMAMPAFAELQAQQGLFPFSLTGPELDKFVKERTAAYGELARTFGLMK